MLISLALTVASFSTLIKGEGSVLSSQHGLAISELVDPSGNDWVNGKPSWLPLISEAVVNGKKVRLHWKPSRHWAPSGWEALTFKCASPRLTISSTWADIGHNWGEASHCLSISNESKSAVTIPLQRTLDFGFSRPISHKLEHWWVEKDAGRPGRVGVHQDLMGPGYRKVVLSRPYESDKEAYAKEPDSRDEVPLSIIYDPVSHTGLYFAIASSGRVSIDLSHPHSSRYVAKIGIAEEPNSSPAFEAVLRPGESYSLPGVIIGDFKGSVDDGVNQLKRKSYPVNPGPLLTLNSWGNDMKIDAPLTHAMISKAAELGMEMFHVDAGWFRSVGDWRANPDKFPKGMEAVSKDAHDHGLKFGLWVGWTQGGIAPVDDPVHVLSVRDPRRRNWFARDFPADWKPSDFVGADLCLAEPSVKEWCIALLRDLVRRYHIDMLEHDQRMVVDECVRRSGAHTQSHGDISNRAAEAYYTVYDKLHAEFPHLMFENCVNGGRMVDFGAAQRASYFSIVDSYDPLSNRQAIYDMGYVLPAAMCECYVMAMPNKNIEEFKTMLRSGMMGWCSIMQDPNKWTAEEQLAAKQEFAFYKKVMRPLIRSGSSYHISPRPDGKQWDANEFVSEDQDRAVVLAFRNTDPGATHRFRLSGLNPGWWYSVVGSNTKFLGADLMKSGLDARVDLPGGSAVILIQAASGS